MSSEGCEGAEPFYLIVDDLVTKPEDDETSRLDMLQKDWDGERYRKIDEAWWKDNPRRGFWDNTKAKRMLGWYHE